MAENRAKKQKRPFMEWLAVERDIPPELLSGGCFIEIRGRNSVVVRGCRRILVYSDTKVVLKTRKDIVSVEGKRLTCISYLVGAVSVEGFIDSVNFSRGEKQ